MEKAVRRAQITSQRWQFVHHLLFFLFLRQTLIPAVAQLTSGTSSAETDLEALWSFQNSFSNTFLSRNWTGSSFCNWFGVSCNNGSRVVELKLDSRQLVGGIPPSLENLTSLEYLDLHRNRLTGGIPLFLGNLSLQYLNLGDNSLTGPIPPSLLSFNSSGSLQHIDLSYNLLTGSIPDFGRSSSLQHVDLSANLLTGSIPPTVRNLSRVQHLDLSQNVLNGSIPRSICALSSTTLHFLSLATNALTGRIPDDLDLCLNLTKLYLGGNFLSGNIPDSLGRFFNLTVLDISFNNLSGNIPELSNSLVTLTLKNNELTGNLSNLSSNLPDSLMLLSLSGNRIGGEIPARIGKLPNLTKLELNDNNFSGSIPDTWLQSSLDTLDFSGNILSGVLPSSIYNLTNLVILKLQGNSLSGSISPSIQKLKNLAILRLDRNSILGSIPASIEFLSRLNIINLAHNNLTGEIPPGIVNLPSVSSLDLSWNRLTGVVPAGLYTLPQWKGANVTTDHNPHLKQSKALPANTSTTDNVTFADAPESEAGNFADGPESKAGKSWTLTMILVIDLILALVDAYGLYVYMILPKPKEEKEEPLPEPSIEYSVSIHELRKATKGFHEDNIVARGARSIVYKGTVGSGQIAVKVLRMENAEKDRESLLRELHTLGRVRHRNVLKILAVCSDLDTKALVLEYMPFSSLACYLYNMVGRFCLSWDTRFNILVGVAQGLVYLHREHQETIIHCDLKPSNILLDSDFEPKVADFGIAKYVHPGSSGDPCVSMSRLCGTIGYIPPEYALASVASTKGDVFSFGIVLLETLTARKPYEGWDIEQGQPGSLVEFVASAYPDRIITILDTNMVTLELDGELHEQEVRLVAQIGLLCTQADPRNRPNMIDVLNMLKDIKIQRFTRAGIQDYPNVHELAQKPTPWERQDDPTGHILQITEETKLEDWIARRMR